MRIDSKPAPISNTSEPREVKGVLAVAAVNPVDVAAHAMDTALRRQYESEPHAHDSAAKKFIEERRKVCRRVQKQAVLIELRTGVECRRKNLRDSDSREHIDEQV